jgi:two-component system CheB/CheR fusion protein
LREMCIFSTHSVIRDPPFSRLDLISCRNLLIYLEPSLQEQIFPLLHYALRPGGHLFLGLSENIGRYAELFVTLDKKNRLFQRRDMVARP